MQEYKQYLWDIIAAALYRCKYIFAMKDKKAQKTQKAELIASNTREIDITAPLKHTKHIVAFNAEQIYEFVWKM